MTSSTLRLIAALTLGTSLTACGFAGIGGGPDLSGVRAGPQAVHPSPSALAQGTAVATTECGAEGQPAC